MKPASKGGSICEHTYEHPRIKIDNIEFVEIDDEAKIDSKDPGTPPETKEA